MSKTTRKEYLKHFSGEHSKEPLDRQKEALKQALDIRKFEIDLYWRRASYFWTFIGATFAGYFVLQNNAKPSFESAYVVTCLGFTFSVAWYFVNRGSKAWQHNWEVQVDLLEDEIMGPLYKSELNRDSFNFWDITEGFPFSPSRINQIMSLFVVVVWLFLMTRALLGADLCSNQSQFWTALFMSALTVTCVVLLVTVGRQYQSGNPIVIEHRMREYQDRP